MVEDVVEDIIKKVIENVKESIEEVEEEEREEITISDEEASKLIEKIKELSVYEEMSDEDDKSVDEEKKSVWNTITSMMNNFRSYLTSK